MQIQFRNNKLAHAYNKPSVAERMWGRAVARKYIKQVSAIFDAKDFEELKGIRSLRLHALKGDRTGTFGVDLTGNMRLVVSIIETDNLTIVLEVVDYHD
jgi:plasmid maintenance system killer protein